MWTNPAGGSCCIEQLRSQLYRPVNPEAQWQPATSLQLNQHWGAELDRCQHRTPSTFSNAYWYTWRKSRCTTRCCCCCVGVLFHRPMFTALDAAWWRALTLKNNVRDNIHTRVPFYSLLPADLWITCLQHRVLYRVLMMRTNTRNAA